MHAKLMACREALDGGVPRTHVISGLRDDSLLTEVFTNEGCGTLIEHASVGAQEPR
jgi:acetylglutamate kinase